MLGRGHVQGVLAKDPLVRSEVQNVAAERRRRELAGVGGDRNAGPMVVFCGLNYLVLDASRGLSSWWAGVLSSLPWLPK